MQQSKPLCFGCVVICPNQCAKSLLSTVKSIKNFHDSPCLAVVPKDTSESVVEEMNVICDVHRGNRTYTSLMNVGIRRSSEDWNFVFFSGTLVKPRFWVKYLSFLNDEKDILFPVLVGKEDFIDGSINGILLHKNTIKKAGKFPEIANLEQSKVTWAAKALEKGCKLKGVLQSKIMA